MSLTVGIYSDLYCAGLTEDGEQFIGHIFFVSAEAPDGRRWVHAQSFKGVEEGFDEEFGYPYFGDVRDEATAKAEALASAVRAHLEAGGKLDLTCWNEADPVYGSNAYESLDSMGYFKDREKEVEVPCFTYIK